MYFWMQTWTEALKIPFIYLHLVSGGSWQTPSVKSCLIVQRNSLSGGNLCFRPLSAGWPLYIKNRKTHNPIMKKPCWQDSSHSWWVKYCHSHLTFLGYHHNSCGWRQIHVNSTLLTFLSDIIVQILLQKLLSLKLN